VPTDRVWTAKDTPDISLRGSGCLDTATPSAWPGTGIFSVFFSG
jgi:hypothetical protein